MSLNFGAANSHVNFSIGNAANVSNGAFTMMTLWLMPSTSLNSGFIAALLSGTDQRSYGVDTAHLFGNNDFSSGFGTLTGAHWYWTAITKPAGAAHYRCHFKDYTAGGAWSHGEAVGAANQTDPGTSNSLQVGAGSAFAASTGDVAVAALWTSELADLTIEALATSALKDLMAGNPQWATRFMQSAPTSIQDLTGGGGNETSRTGTITTTADPPAFDFSLTAAIGQQATNRHPGKSPGKARFFQSPRPTNAGNVVTIDGSLTVTASRTATVAVTHTIGGSLAVTANRTATVAVTHTVGGSLTVTASRTATVAVTHTIGGSRPTTVNRTATIAVTHTIGGSLVVTASRTATVAVTHTIGGSRPVTVNRAATVAVTHTISGSRPITVNLVATADVPGVVNISGSLVVTASRTATVAVVHTVSGSLIVVVTRSATAGTSQRTYLFLPFFG
jgi:hypothetical protein